MLSQMPTIRDEEAMNCERIPSTSEVCVSRLRVQLTNTEREIAWRRQHEEKHDVMLELANEMLADELRTSIAFFSQGG